MTLDDLRQAAEAVSLSEPDLEDLAERCAAHVQGLAQQWQRRPDHESAARRSMHRIARAHRVELSPRLTGPQLLNRLTCAAWWRRALRKRFRTAERYEVARGAVHRAASPYVSAHALSRHRRNQRRTADLLQAMEALNLETGEVVPLLDLVEASQANPTNRRAAMMVRIRGLEADACSKGEVAAMLTITTPSRMHARHHTGQANARYDGTTPRAAQAHLHGVWRRAMRKLAREGITLRGLRTVEPHHDGCPHWHVLVFAPEPHLQRACELIRAGALQDCPDEPGADQRRFRVEHIDPAKGCAVAYVSKYVSKSIDGHALDDDDETGGDGPSTAERVVAWARTWGIRQFQFFGLPPVTPMRELYRVAAGCITNAALALAHQACKANDHAAYLAALDGPALCLRTTYQERPSSRYPGETTHAVQGLSASGADLAAPFYITTRTERWCVQPRAAARTADTAAGLPWTRFNNCAPSAASSTYALTDTAPRTLVADKAREGRRRKPNGSRQAAMTAA
jgi:hypothetical protein